MHCTEKCCCLLPWHHRRETPGCRAEQGAVFSPGNVTTGSATRLVPGKGAQWHRCHKTKDLPSQDPFQIMFFMDRKNPKHADLSPIFLGGPVGRRCYYPPLVGK